MLLHTIHSLAGDSRLVFISQHLSAPDLKQAATWWMDSCSLSTSNPRSGEVGQLLKHFWHWLQLDRSLSNIFHVGKEHSGLKDFKLNIDVSDTMPELEYAQILLREFNKYLHLKGILGQLINHFPLTFSDTSKQIPPKRQKGGFETYISRRCGRKMAI